MTTATIIAILVGLVSPFILKYAPASWKGAPLALGIFIVSFLVAAGVLLATGGTAGWSWQNAAVDFVALYGTQQAVYAAFKDALKLSDPSTSSAPPPTVVPKPPGP